MKMRLLITALTLMLAQMTFAQEVVTVNESDNQGWFEKGETTGTGGLSMNNPHGPGDTGSLEMITDGSDGQIVQAARIPLITVDAIIAVGWDFSSDHATNYPVAKIEYYSISPPRSGTLVYQRSGTYTPGTWETVNGVAGMWWSTEAGFGGGDLRTLAEWQVQLAGILANYLVVGVGSTSGGVPASTSYVDLVHLQTADSNTIWDFESEGPLPPLPIETVTVDASNPEGWFEKSGSTATGALSTNNPHGTGGTGSLEFILDGTDGQIIQAARIPLVTVDDILAVGWDFSSDHATSYPTAKIEYYSITPPRVGTLVYIRSGTYTPGTWETVDGMAGMWYSTEDGFGSGDPRTLPEWQIELRGILSNYFVVGLGTTVGSGPVSTSYIDMVHLQTSRFNNVWDFESEGVLPPPPLETVTVTADNLAGWFEKSGTTGIGALTINNPHGPGGLGSLEFNTDGSAGQIVQAARIPLITVDQITALEWDFYSDNADGNSYPVAKIEYFNLSRSGTLVYEVLTPYTPDTWQSEDGFTGTWWSTEAGFGSSDKRTLVEWQDELRGVLSNFFVIGMGNTGGAFPVSNSFIDVVHLETTAFNTLWDFEGEALLPPELPLVVVTVDADNKEGWFGMDQAGAATGAITETNPHGDGNTGSLEFTTSGSTEDIIHAARVPLVPFNQIDAIQYDFYSDHATWAPVLKVQYWDGTRFGTLQYEPINQGPYATNTWITEDGFTGLWWSTEFGQGDLRTFAQWKTDIGAIPVTFLQVGVGSGWGGVMTGHADMIRLQTATDNIVWDFEHAAPLPPPPLEILTVTPTEPQGWFEKSGSTAVGELTVNNPHGPGGLGSLEFTLDGSAGQIIQAARIPVIFVDDITAVGWDFYSATGDANSIPTAKIEYYQLNGRSGTLVYEGPASYTPATWQTEDGFTGLWWSTEDSGATRQTLAEWQVELAGVFSNFFVVGVGSTGGAIPASTSFIDLVHLQTSRFNTMWDFEGVAPLPPPPQDTITTITSTVPAPSIVGQSVVVNYTVTATEVAPTGDVTVSDGTNTCIGTVAAGNCTLTFVIVGTKTLTATYAGATDFNPSVSVPYDHEVIKADTTTVISNSLPNPSMVGESVAISYSVTSGDGNPTGTVTVSDGTNSCSGTVVGGSCTITFSTVGVKSLVADYAGDVNFNVSTSAAASHEVVQIPTVTTITSSVPNPSEVGTVVTISYTVTGTIGTPVGNVTVGDGTDSCTGTVAAGSCTITFATVGVKSLVADYAGDVDYMASTSVAYSHEVVQIPTVTTITSSAPNPSVINEAVTISYTVTATSGTPVGNVTVGDGTDSCTGTVAAGSCTITFATLGVKSLVADYAGDVDYIASTSVAYSHEVVQAATVTTITSSAPNPSVINETVTISYTVTATSGTPTGDVTVGDGTDSCTGTVAAGSCTITFATVGIKSLVADYAGDVSFAASTSAAYSHEVTLVATVTTVTGSTPNPSAIDEAVAITYTVTAGSSTPTVQAAGGGATKEAVPTGNVTVSDGTDSCTALVADGGCSITFATAGTKSLVASYAGDAMHAPSVSAAFEHIVSAPPVVAPAKPIPTLSQWALLLLTLLMGMVAFGRLGRRTQ